MLNECEKLLKQAWNMVNPKDPRLKWNYDAADNAITADLDRIRSAGNYDRHLMEDLRYLLQYRMFQPPVMSWTSVDVRYRAMLLLLRHRNAMTAFDANWDAVLALMGQARPLYRKLSRNDPFPDVFGSQGLTE